VCLSFPRFLQILHFHGRQQVLHFPELHFQTLHKLAKNKMKRLKLKRKRVYRIVFFSENGVFCCQSSKHWRQSVANIAMIQSFQGPLLSTPSHFPSPSQPLKSDCNPPVGSGEKNALKVSKKLIRIQNKQGTSAWLKTAGSILLVTCGAVFLRNGRTSFS